MAKYVRYAMASVCFAASVACLALWWRSCTHTEVFDAPRILEGETLHLAAVRGKGILVMRANTRSVQWGHSSILRDKEETFSRAEGDTGRNFKAEWTRNIRRLTFPIWYPALVFAVAGVGVILFRRQFSIRSALIAFAVVAALLGMPLAL